MFFYYFPGDPNIVPTRESLAAGPLKPILWDLLASPTLFDRRVRSFAIHANGPDGMSGRLLAAMPANLEGPVPGMREGQTWLPVGDIDGKPEYWIGFDSLPSPEILQREHIVPGEEAELGDGRVWICPTVRRKGAIIALPTSWGVDRKGDFIQEVLPEYSRYWEASGEILNLQISDDVRKSQAMLLCVEMLQVNYRVGVREVAALRLLNDVSFPLVWRAATDAAFVEEWLASLDSEGNPQKKS